MNIFKKIVSALLMFVGIASFCLSLLFIYTAPGSIQRGKTFNAKYMVPAIEYIEAFHKTNGVLPTSDQFMIWKESKGWGNRSLDILPKNTKGGRFELSAWRGNWHEYYYSWKKNSFTADDIGVIGIALYFLLGAIFFSIGLILWKKHLTIRLTRTAATQPLG